MLQGLVSITEVVGACNDTWVVLKLFIIYDSRSNKDIMALMDNGFNEPGNCVVCGQCKVIRLKENSH